MFGSRKKKLVKCFKNNLEVFFFFFNVILCGLIRFFVGLQGYIVLFGLVVFLVLYGFIRFYVFS